MSDQAYRLPVWETIVAAWNATYGAKKTLWASLIIIIMIAGGFGFISKLLENRSLILAAITDLTGQFIVSILQIGVLSIGIRRALNKPIQWNQMFDVFHIKLILNLTVLYALQLLLVLLPILILAGGAWLAIDGFYETNFAHLVNGATLILIGAAAVAYLCLRIIFSIAFILDQNMNAKDAMKMSFQLTKGNVLPLLGAIILEMIIFTVSIIPLGIGLLWSIPFTYVLYGELYSELLKNSKN